MHNFYFIFRNILSSVLNKLFENYTRGYYK